MARRSTRQPAAAQYGLFDDPNERVDLEFFPAPATADDLISQLRGAKSSFKRPAVPAVNYIVNQVLTDDPRMDNNELAEKIVDRYGVPKELHVQLDHEIYLARAQVRLAEAVQRRDDARGRGMVPITEIEPSQGLEVVRQDGLKYRFTRNGLDDWLLLPPGARTKGLSFRALCEKHRDFEGAERFGAPTTSNWGEVMVQLQVVERSRRSTRSTPQGQPGFEL